MTQRCWQMGPWWWIHFLNDAWEAQGCVSEGGLTQKARSQNGKCDRRRHVPSERQRHTTSGCRLITPDTFCILLMFVDPFSLNCNASWCLSPFFFFVECCGKSASPCCWPGCSASPRRPENSTPRAPSRPRTRPKGTCPQNATTSYCSGNRRCCPPAARPWWWRSAATSAETGARPNRSVRRSARRAAAAAPWSTAFATASATPSTSPATRARARATARVEAKPPALGGGTTTRLRSPSSPAPSAGRTASRSSRCSWTVPTCSPRSDTANCRGSSSVAACRWMWAATGNCEEGPRVKIHHLSNDIWGRNFRLNYSASCYTRDSSHNTLTWERNWHYWTTAQPWHHHRLRDVSRLILSKDTVVQQKTDDDAANFHR